MKNRVLSRILIILGMTVGLGMLCYPALSDFTNQYTQSRAIAAHAQDVSQMDASLKEELMAKAMSFNESIAGDGVSFNTYTATQQMHYEELLDMSGDGMMGYLDIPSLGIHLGIYHGTDESVMGAGIGHLEGSSLPIGGESVHAVLTSHTGLPSAKLFTEIDQLEKGDTFNIHILDEIHSYEVDQIKVVLPSEVDLLAIEEGEDLVTLMTCTPIGVNSHRLLVRGHRVPTAEQPQNMNAAQMLAQNQTLWMIPAISAAILIPILFLSFFIYKSRTEKRLESGNMAAKTMQACENLPDLPENMPEEDKLPKLPGSGVIK